MGIPADSKIDFFLVALLRSLFLSIFHRILVVFFVDLSSFLRVAFIDRRVQNIHTICGALFHSTIVDDGETPTLKILVLPRKNHGF